MTKLYHADVFWPSIVKRQVPSGPISLTYSGHALTAAADDKYGRVSLPRTVDLDKAKIFEAELDSSRKLVKITLRVNIDETRDLAIPIVREGGNRWFAKTVWINLVGDKHRTLDKSRYIRK